MFKVPEKNRILTGKLGSTKKDKNNGLFIITYENKKSKSFLACIASDGGDWQHVSVTNQYNNRCPTWHEMCFVKDTFWSDNDCVIQYHPEKSNYVNTMKFCLHLWRPTNHEIPTPPIMYV